MPGSIDPLAKDRVDEQLYAALLKGKPKSRQRDKKVTTTMTMICDGVEQGCVVCRLDSFIVLVAVRNEWHVSRAAWLKHTRVRVVFDCLMLLLTLVGVDRRHV